MCGRFANPFESVQEWKEHFGDGSVLVPDDATMGYNTAPTQTIPVITASGLLVARWGMIPTWSDKVSSKYATHNARSESVAEKPTFQHAWNNGQRCLIPALGYYEWKKQGNSKQPYFVTSNDGSPLAFFGVYEPSRTDIPASCSILTKPACDDISDLHPRMPIISGLQLASSWLQGECEYPSVLEFTLHAYAVDRGVNNPRAQSSTLIDPIPA